MTTPGLRGLALRRQLLLAFGLISLLVLMMSSVMVYGMLTISEKSQQAIEHDGTMGQLASEVGMHTLQMRRFEKDVFLNLSTAARTEYFAQWEASGRDLDAAIERYERAAQTAQDRQQAAAWRDQKAIYDTRFREIINAINAGSITTTSQANDALTPIKGTIRDLTDTSILTHETKAILVRESGAQLIATSGQILTLIIGAAALTLLATIGWALIFPTRLTRPIRSLQEAASRFGAGELETRAVVMRDDELGQLAQDFNQMAATIRQHIVDQQRAHEQLQQASATKVAKEELEEVVRIYSSFAADVARGDLTVRLALDGRNGELGQLGHSLNRMVSSLHSVTQQVKEASTNIASAAAEILAATTQQAAAATEQTAALTEAGASIEQIKAIAIETAQQARHVAQESQDLLQIARQGGQAVEQTIGGMGQIKQRVEHIAESIMSLSEQTQAIATITATVSQLADQSNLLALNAAIEAARSGEQGRGFAIVAQHVRGLAERSKAATADVREILGEIQRAANAAVLVTEEGSKGVQAGSAQAQQAGMVIQRMMQEVEQGAQANTQMAMAAQQQTAGMDQMVIAMNDIQQAMTQSLASTRQAEQAAGDLHQLAQQLQSAVKTYVV